MKNKDILALVQDGTITAEEAVKLMEVVEEEEIVRIPAVDAVANQQAGLGKMLKIIVDSNEGGKNSKVRINVPLAFVKLAMSMGKGLDINGVNLSDKVDIDVIMKAIDDGLVGEIVNVDADDTQVRIFID